MVEEGEAFLVRDAGKGVVRVFALEVGDEFGEFVLFAEVVDGVGEGFPAYDGGEIAGGFSMTGYTLFLSLLPA